jgi:hypothetical protein
MYVMCFQQHASCAQGPFQRAHLFSRTFPVRSFKKEFFSRVAALFREDWQIGRAVLAGPVWALLWLPLVFHSIPLFSTTFPVRSFKKEFFSSVAPHFRGEWQIERAMLPRLFRA